MSFLRINGWEVPVKSSSEEIEDLGVSEPVFSGALFRDRRASKKNYQLETIPVDEMTAEAIKGAVRVDGEVFPFDDDTYSRKGMPADSGTSANVFPGQAVSNNATATVTDVNGVAESKYGAGALQPRDAVDNLLGDAQRNPSDIADFTQGGGSPGGISLDTGYYIKATSSAKVSAALSATEIRSTPSATGSQAQSVAAGTYTFSVYVAGSSASLNINVKINGSVSGTTSSAATTSATAGEWKRFAVSHTASAGEDLSCRVELTSITEAIYTDCWQLEAASSASPWIDSGSASADNLKFTRPFFGSGDASIVAWVKAPSAAPSAEAVIVRCPNSDSSEVVRLSRTTSGDLVLRTIAGGTTDDLTIADFFDDDWHHVAAVLRFDPETGESTKTVYVDGAEAGTSNPATSATPSPAGLVLATIGSVGSVSHWIGNLDDVQILPYAMPAEQVSAIYSMAKAMPETPGTFYYDGDITRAPELTKLAKGDVSAETTPRTQAGTWKNNAQTVSFNVREN